MMCSHAELCLIELDTYVDKKPWTNMHHNWFLAQVVIPWTLV